jgi:hypothetical protein
MPLMTNKVTRILSISCALKEAATRLEASTTVKQIALRMAFEFKEEFDRSKKSPLSATIIIDRSTFLESTGTADTAEGYRQQHEWSDRDSAPGRITASAVGDLPGVSRVMWTDPREVERRRQVFWIRTL